MSIISEALKKVQDKRVTWNEKDGIFSEAEIPRSYASTPERSFFLPQRVIPRMVTGIVVAVLFLGTGLFFLSTRQAPVIREKYDVPANKHSTEVTPIDKTTASAVYDKHPSPPEQKPQTFMPQLSGIMYSADNPKAIINGILLSEGESIDDFHVVEILPGRVKIKQGEKDHIMELR